MTIPPFHLAFPVKDLEQTRGFYRDLLGCEEGRSTDRWVDFAFFGHQISAHLGPSSTPPPAAGSVDGTAVPVPHFGAVLAWDDWHRLADRLRAANADFVIEPQVRFKGERGEQATMFICDPSGNALEFKAFLNQDELFAH